MLVVKTEIWPHGDDAQAYEIARLGIVNVRGSRILADYDVIGLLDRDRAERVATTQVTGHFRPAGWSPLVSLALLALDTTPCSVTYAQEIVDLLRKDHHDRPGHH